MANEMVKLLDGGGGFNFACFVTPETWGVHWDREHGKGLRAMTDHLRDEYEAEDAYGMIHLAAHSLGFKADESAIVQAVLTPPFNERPMSSREIALRIVGGIRSGLRTALVAVEYVDLAASPPERVHQALERWRKTGNASPDEPSLMTDPHMFPNQPPHNSLGSWRGGITLNGAKL